jgi:plasmid stabilization system protein ParE
MRLSLTKAAQHDIDMLHAHGQKNFGRSVADNYVRQLLDLLDLLEGNPLMGLVRTGFKIELRTIRYREHLVFYRANKRAIKVIRILHSSQNWSDMF